MNTEAKFEKATEKAKLVIGLYGTIQASITRCRNVKSVLDEKMVTPIPDQDETDPAFWNLVIRILCKSEPRFLHDCDECKYLGYLPPTPLQANARLGDMIHEGYDLYYCEKQSGHIPTVIARYDSAGPNYHSGMELSVNLECLAEAKRRAQEFGYIK